MDGDPEHGRRERGEIDMKVSDCTKAELVWIVNWLTGVAPQAVGRAMASLEQQKELSLAEKMDRLAQDAYEKQQRYFELLRQYDGAKLADIPLETLEEALRLNKQVEELDAEYLRLWGTLYG